MNPALLLIAASFAIALALGIRARRGHPMTLEQWSVGGRGFGTIFVFLLMAGEIYTTFTFLGGSGWAYGKGAPAFYILCYGTIAYGLSYFLLPVIWRYANAHAAGVAGRLLRRASTRAERSASSSSLVSVAALVPYLVLQLKGLGIIVSEASYGAISSDSGRLGGSLALVTYVVVSGVRGSAWTAALKDMMILVVVALVLGTYLPAHYYGGFGPMFAPNRQREARVSHAAADGHEPRLVHLDRAAHDAWASTCGRSTFASVYTARNEDVFRKNAVVLPLYQLVRAVRVLRRLRGDARGAGPQRGRRSTCRCCGCPSHAFGPWMLGVIGAAGLLTALVPGSMLLMSAATILAKNVYRQARARGEPIAGYRALARALVPVVALVSVVLTLRGGQAHRGAAARWATTW